MNGRDSRNTFLLPQYLNDSSLKNVHWAVCTGIFGKRDVGRIEREFLDVLDFELSISEDDIMAHHDTIMSLFAPARHIHSRAIPARRPLPELGYSSGSPSSSDASFSPRTPHTVAEENYPMDVDLPRSKSGEYETYPVAPARAHVAQSHSRHEKRSSHASTFRIFRSFPFSRPFGHSSSSSSSSSSSTSSSRSEPQAPLQNVAQPGRCQLIPPFAAQPSTQVYA